MNNPNTIENQVLTILKENTDARNDDMKLYLLVCNRCYQRYENQDIGGLPFAVIMNCYKELHLPHFESVRRSRAKLQASHPELAPSPEVQRGRKRCEHMPIGMLVVLDSILNRITQNRAKGKQTFIFIDEIYLLFQHEYSANFLFTLWKRVRKYGAYATGITQNVDDLLQSHTARTMLANSEFLIMLNQASTDRLELAKLLNISDRQLSYITNVDAGHGLIKVGSSLVPFANKFPKNTKLYKLMTTKPGEGA